MGWSFLVRRWPYWYGWWWLWREADGGVYFESGRFSETSYVNDFFINGCWWLITVSEICEMPRSLLRLGVRPAWSMANWWKSSHEPWKEATCRWRQGCLKKLSSVVCQIRGTRMIEPMRNLKEAVAKIATQTWCESLEGLEGRMRHLPLSKSYILSVFRLGKGGG